MLQAKNIVGGLRDVATFSLHTDDKCRYHFHLLKTSEIHLVSMFHFHWPESQQIHADLGFIPFEWHWKFDEMVVKCSWTCPFEPLKRWVDFESWVDFYILFKFDEMIVKCSWSCPFEPLKRWVDFESWVDFYILFKFDEMIVECSWNCSFETLSWFWKLSWFLHFV